MKKIIYIFIFSMLFVSTFLINSKASNGDYAYKVIDLVFNDNFTVTQYNRDFYNVIWTFNVDDDIFKEYILIDGVLFFTYDIEQGDDIKFSSFLEIESIQFNGNELSGIVRIPRNYFTYYYQDVLGIDEQTFFNSINQYMGDLSNYFKLFVKIEYKSKQDYLREYFYRMPPKTRPANLYNVGMAYRSGTAYAGRLYWWLDDYIDISNYVDDYKAFLSYTFVDKTYLYRIFFFDENQNEVATVFIPDYEEYIYKFDNENRHVVGMLHFKDAYTNNYINFDNVKYMQVEYHTEPYPDSSVLINLTQTLDISIGEFWRTAEAFNSYYQAGYNEGNMIGFAEGQEKIRSEIVDMLKDEYDRGYEDGLEAAPDEAYERGYIKGANESFIGTMDKWLVPAIIIVMLLGGFFTIARKKQEGDI